MKVLGAVLAGGRSLRFGSDKALATIRGKTLLDHTISNLQQITQEIVVCGRLWAGHLALEDRPRAGMGPLGGLNAALRHAQTSDFDWVLTLPCDTPFVDASVLAVMIAIERAAYIEQQPAIGLWPTRVQGALEAFLDSHRKHSLQAFGQTIQAESLSVEGEILNFNFAGDLQKWRARQGCNE